jgi:hypothetical protein
MKLNYIANISVSGASEFGRGVIIVCLERWVLSLDFLVFNLGIIISQSSFFSFYFEFVLLNLLLTVWKCILDMLPALNFLILRMIHDHDQGETETKAGASVLWYKAMLTRSQKISTCAIHDAEADEKQPINEKVTKCCRTVLFSGTTFRTYNGSKLSSRGACCWHYFYPCLAAHYIMSNWKWKDETALRNPDLSSWTQEIK